MSKRINYTVQSPSGNANTVGNIFTTAGNVGIGIVTPSTLLHLKANVSTQGHVLIDDPAPTIWAANLGASAAVLTLKSGFAANGETDALRSKFKINAWSSDTNQLNAFIFTTQNDSERMRIINNGNVGIGTSAPSFLLDVNGTARFTTGITSPSAQITNATITSASISTLINTNASCTNISSGSLQLSLGLTSPSAQITNATITSASIGTLINTNAISTNISSGSLQLSTRLSALGTSNTIGSIFTTGGNVGLGTSAPTANLEVYQNINDNMGINITNDNTGGSARANFNLRLGTTGAGGQIYSSGADPNFTFRSFSGNTSGIVLNASSALGSVKLSTADTVRMTISSNGSVGIGTSTPSSLLHVNGSALFTNVNSTNMTISNLVVNSGFNASNANVSLYGLSVSTNITTGAVFAGAITAGGLTVKGTNASASIIGNGESDNVTLFLGTPYLGDVSNGLKTALIAQGKTNWSRARLHFCLDDAISASTAPNAALAHSRMMIESNGYVGIGTTIPSASLDVNGSAVIRGTTTIVPISHTPLDISYTNASGAFPYGNNTTSGTILLKSYDGGVFGGSWRPMTLHGNVINLSSGLSNFNTRLHIDNNGNIGIGTTSPSYSLHVAGDVYASGDVISFSDERLKTDITTITGALDKVGLLRGVYYKHVETQIRGTGVIAQEIEQVLPEVTDSRGEYKGVSYGNVVGVLIEAIKELNNSFNQLKQDFEALKSLTLKSLT